MKEIVVEIKNEQGVHARPAGQIVNIAKRYKVTLEIEKIEYLNKRKSLEAFTSRQSYII